MSGTSFNIDGHTGYFAGTNSYWIGFLTNNDDVDLVMSHLAASGLKVLRVWGFNIATSTPSSSTIYYQSLVPGSPPAINTGATGLERLDYVVQSAEANGIKLVVNFANNWSDYGGVPAYMTYYNLTQEQWYTSSEAQATYQAYIEAVVSRYSTSTAIFAWELMNEPRCHGCDTSVLTSWAATTSAYIKSLDGNHLVTLGDEGFAPSAGDVRARCTARIGVADDNHRAPIPSGPRRVLTSPPTSKLRLLTMAPTTCIPLPGAPTTPPGALCGFNR